MEKGALALATDLGSGSEQQVAMGGSAKATHINSGAFSNIASGGASQDTVVSGGTLILDEGAQIIGTTVIEKSGSVVLGKDITENVGGSYALEMVRSEGNNNKIVLGSGDDSRLYPEDVAQGNGSKARDIITTSPVGRTLTINHLEGSAKFIFNVDVDKNTGDKLIVHKTTNSTHNIAKLRLVGNIDVSKLRGLQLVQAPSTFLLEGTKAEELGPYACSSEFLYVNGWWEFSDFKATGISSLGKTIKQISTMEMASWRQGDAALESRMASLGASREEDHIWAKVSNTSLGIGEATAKTYTLDTGYDARLSDSWRLGLALKHGKSTNSFQRAQGDMQENTLGVYARWQDSTKQFVELAVRAGALHNEYRATNGDASSYGDYTAWGYGLSAKYGQSFQSKRSIFTPYVKVGFDGLRGVDYLTSDGISVGQNSAHSLYGKLGMSLRQELRRDASLYLDMALLHEFAGKVQVRAASNGLAPIEIKDNIKGTWVDFTLGYKESFDKNSFWHLEVGRSGLGSSVARTNWRYSAGVEFKF